MSEGAGALADACELAVQDAERGSASTGYAAESETASALKYSVRALLSLYAEFFGRKASVSKDGHTGRAIGPALRFVQGVLKIMGVDTSDENVLRISKDLKKANKPGDLSKR